MSNKLFHIPACQAGPFKRAAIHLLWWVLMIVPVQRFPHRWLPWIGCYGYAEDRRECGERGCTSCNPSGGDRHG